MLHCWAPVGDPTQAPVPLPQGLLTGIPVVAGPGAAQAGETAWDLLGVSDNCSVWSQEAE